MKKVIHIMAATAFAGFAISANAATIVQTKGYSYIPAGSAPLVFNQFDTSLGTLTSITITTNVTKSGGSIAVDNDSETPASGNISQTVTITLSSGDVALITQAFQPIGSNLTAVSTYSATVGADDGDGPGVQTTGSDYDGTTFGDSLLTSQTRNVSTDGFSGYEGTGTFVINVDGTQGFNTSAIGGAAVAIDPATAFGDVIITYTYEAIPEPTTALLGCLGAFGLLRRRR